MIIDRVRLAGDAAYLTERGSIDLAAVANQYSGSNAIRRIQVEGLGLEVAGVHLLLRAENMHRFYARATQSGDPLLAFHITKEMFPDFFADPYANRVHSIAGFEDFRRGSLINMRAMEVEGKATLVSLAWGECSWTSPIYMVPMVTSISSLVWELASARISPDEGFSYTIALDFWQDWADPTTVPPTQVRIAPETGREYAHPGDLRYRSGLNGLQYVTAYRINFRAQVHRGADLFEAQYGPDDGRSLGRPLLRAVHLLEPIASAYTFRSLHELEMRSSDFSFLEPALPLQTLSAYVPMPVLLVHDEQIALEVPPGIWEAVEARLDAEARVRPPVLNHLIGDQA